MVIPYLLVVPLRRPPKEFFMDIGLKRNLRTLWVFVIAIVIAGCLRAQDITGNWQGTITSPQGKPLRIVLQVTHDDPGALKAKIYSIDQHATGDWADFITLHESTVKFVVGMIQLSYEGKLSADGKTIIGTWTQGSGTPFTFRKATKATAWALPTDPTPHAVQFVTVEPGVKLEVLDWGGSGRPLVFLAGLGDTAHVFDSFAPKSPGRYHVYGITRRGFGESSYPTPNGENYSADRLGDDVLAVISALRLQKPVLIGHSIAGEELSSIGSRHPERVSGLIYLECSGSHSFYDRAHGDLQLDMIDVRNKIEQLLPYGGDPSGPIQPIEVLLASLPQLEKELQNQVKLQRAVSPPTAHPSLPQDPHPNTASAVAAIMSGEQKYTEIKVPCLAFFAVPHDLSRAFQGDAARHAAVVAADLERQTRLANAFEAGVPSAKVIRLLNANHYIFRSNEAEVLRAMNDFLDRLPKN
jgi:pimeloyl-ACP methyl ester carboxylesterase